MQLKSLDEKLIHKFAEMRFQNLALHDHDLKLLAREEADLLGFANFKVSV